MYCDILIFLEFVRLKLQNKSKYTESLKITSKKIDIILLSIFLGMNDETNVKQHINVAKKHIHDLTREVTYLYIPLAYTQIKKKFVDKYGISLIEVSIRDFGNGYNQINQINKESLYEYRMSKEKANKLIDSTWVLARSLRMLEQKEAELKARHREKKKFDRLKITTSLIIKIIAGVVVAMILLLLGLRSMK